jgi:predicted MFS family arabinose efflux permease
MRLVARVLRLIWGADLDRALRPVIAVNLCSTLAFSSAYTFLGIWAIERLGATSSQLGVTFLVGATVGSLGGYLGGHLSDHFGRKPLILFGLGAQAIVVLGYAIAGDRVLFGLAVLVLMWGVGSIGWTTAQAFVADLVPREHHEAAYAAVRVANNLGITLGPPVGGLLLLGDSWTRLFVGVSVMASGAFLVAARFLPRRGVYSPEEPPTRGSFGVIRRDHVFLLFLVSTALAYLVYVAWETALPISAVDTYGISATTWGFLFVINPALVTLFQLRLTHRVERWPAGPKLVTAMVLMGFPFLLLSVNASIPVFVFVIVVFVIGEMLWIPTSQSIAARLAPVDLRGAYMGAFGSTSAVGFALGPFAGLQLRDAAGDTAMWSFYAAVAVAAAATGVIAIRVALGRGGGEAEPAPATAA